MPEYLRTRLGGVTTEPLKNADFAESAGLQ